MLIAKAAKYSNAVLINYANSIIPIIQTKDIQTIDLYYSSYIAHKHYLATRPLHTPYKPPWLTKLTIKLVFSNNKTYQLHRINTANNYKYALYYASLPRQHHNTKATLHIHTPDSRYSFTQTLLFLNQPLVNLYTLPDYIKSYL